VSVLKFSLALMMFLVLASQFFVFEAFASVSENEATLALADAERAVVSAYQEALKAEEVGANVSGLLVRLNEAGGYLGRAEIAFRLGDFEAAINFVNVCSEISEGVKIEADGLRMEAYGPRYMDVWLRMTGSILGMIVMGVGSFWAWRVFKRRYYRRVLDMKPEVVVGEP